MNESGNGTVSESAEVTSANEESSTGELDVSDASPSTVDRMSEPNVADRSRSTSKVASNPRTASSTLIASVTSKKSQNQFYETNLNILATKRLVRQSYGSPS